MNSELEDILPKRFRYKLLDFKRADEKGGFDCTFRVNLFTEPQVLRWLRAFELCSYTNFRVTRTAPGKRTRIIFKKYYRCHHNTRASEQASKTKKPHMKHTGCEATLLITVNNRNMKRCKDPDLQQYPCIIRYHNVHNHVLKVLLCHRKPLADIEERIRDLFLKNHAPAAALRILKQDLLEEFRDEHPDVLKDGAFCPKIQWIYQKYYKMFVDTHPNFQEDEPVSDLTIEENRVVNESETSQLKVEVPEQFCEDYIVPCDPAQLFLSELIGSDDDSCNNLNIADNNTETFTATGVEEDMIDGHHLDYSLL